MEINIHLIIPEIFLLSFAIAILVLDFFIENKRFLAILGIFGLIISGIILILGPKKGFALGGMVVQDGMAVFFKLLFIITGIFILHMGVLFEEKIRRWRGEFYALILFAVLAMVFLASVNDFISLYVSLEFLAITLYILATFTSEESHSVEAGMKYLITGALASGFLLYGITFIYGVSGSTSFEVIAEVLTGKISNGFLLLGLFLFVLGLTFKISAIPFHVWAPDVYQGAPTPVTALLAAGSKAAGFVLLVRVLFTVLGSLSNEWIFFIAFLSALTILFGNLAAMPQKNIKRMLAYAGIGSAGYILMGVASASTLGLGSVMFYLLAYLFGIVGSFLVIVTYSKVSGSDAIDDYVGLSRRSPLLAATMFIGLLSLAGVPPLGGFIAKFYIFAAAIQKGLILLAIIGVVMAIVAMYYFLLVIKRMYLMEPVTDEPIRIDPYTKAVLYGINIVTILLGVYPGPFTDWLIEVAKGILIT